jgi:hypothetical protein
MLIANMRQEEFPDWMDETGIGQIGVFHLERSRRITAEITAYDEDRDELIVNVIASNRVHPSDGEQNYAIPVDHVLSFVPQSRDMQSWPYSDPCRSAPSSLGRFLLLTTLFLSATIGSIPLFLTMQGPWPLQQASVITYTLAVTWLTFSASRENPRYLLTCPAVRPQLPRLLLRHFAFLLALMVVETAASAVHPRLTDWWNVRDAKGWTPFEFALLLVCMALGFTQVYTNRSLLKHAHREFSH